MDNDYILEILKEIKEELYSIKLALRKERDYYDGVKILHEASIHDERAVENEEAVLQVIRCFATGDQAEDVFYSVVICFRESYEPSRSGKHITLQNFMKLDKAVSYFNKYIEKNGTIIQIYE